MRRILSADVITESALAPEAHRLPDKDIAARLRFLGLLAQAKGYPLRSGCAKPHWVKTTRYFQFVVLGRRPYLELEWIELVLRAPEHREIQGDGRIRQWGYIEELKRYLRVVTLPDGETVHNAFPDRRFEVPER